MKTTFTFLTLGMALMATSALACDKGHDGPCPMMKDGKPCPMMLDKNAKPMKHDGHHGGHTMPATQGVVNDSTRAYEEANATMHKDMTIKFSGDADIDFLRGMIPHHQGAIDMARVQLTYGSHPQVKRLTRAIIAAQELEIRQMTTLLKQLEANKKGHSDSVWLGDH